MAIIGGLLRFGCAPLAGCEAVEPHYFSGRRYGLRFPRSGHVQRIQLGRCRPLRREPDRGVDASLEDGIGLGAVWGRAGDLQRPGEEPQEGRRVCAAHLLALP